MRITIIVGKVATNVGLQLIMCTTCSLIGSKQLKTSLMANIVTVKKNRNHHKRI